MWTLLTGYMLSNTFELGTIELFREKFSNKTLSIIEITIGWFFQEYIKEEFDMTGGKKFILESDYRNRFLTQIFKIVRDFIIYSHLITFLELGTFLFLLFFSFSITIKFRLPKMTPQFFSRLDVRKRYLFKNYEFILNRIFREIYANWNLNSGEVFLFSTSFFIFRYGFLKIFSWFDVYFIFRPVLLLFFILSSWLSFLIFNYLFYVMVLKKISKNLSFVLKLFTKNFFFCFICTSVFLEVAIHTLNTQNLMTENFFKETFFTVLLFLPL
jgi:hypothetical protein